MEGGFPEQSAQVRPGSRVEQPEPYVFRREARGSDERGIAFLSILTFFLKIQVRSSGNKRLDQGQFAVPFQCAIEAHVRDVMQWLGVAVLDGCLDVHISCHCMCSVLVRGSGACRPGYLSRYIIVVSNFAGSSDQPSERPVVRRAPGMNRVVGLLHAVVGSHMHRHLARQEIPHTVERRPPCSAHAADHDLPPDGTLRGAARVAKQFAPCSHLTP
jgi:hypothetical protein